MAASGLLGVPMVSLAACTHAVERAGSGEVDRASITGDRVMMLLRELPAARASNGDEEHRTGLRATERLLIQKLKDLGYEPIVQAIEPGKPAANIPRPSSPTAPDTETPAQAPRPEPSKPAPADAPRAAPPPSQPGSPEAPSPSIPPVKLPPREVWNNLIVEITGTKAPNEVLILTAHFDAVPGTPGADDDGTGTVAILEIARVLKGFKPERTIRLVLFNLEEVGLLGSIHYVRSIKPALDAKQETIVGMVSLEMLGYFSDAPNSQRSPIPNIPGVFEARTVGDFLALTTTKKHAAFAQAFAAAMRRSEPAFKVFVAADFIPDLPITPRDLLRSDHAPFLYANQPGTMLTDTSNFRNPHYHKATDTVETLDAERFALGVRAIAGAAAELSKAAATSPPTPPGGSVAPGEPR